MKAFVLLVLMILLFVFLSVTGVARVNMTPETAAVGAQSFAPVQPQVITIQDSTPGLAVVPESEIVPVTGAPTCTDPYIVRQGDILSGIAVLCNTTVGAIRLANPQITNVNLIYPGMAIRIPGGAPVVVTDPIPVTGGDKAGFSDWSAAPEVLPVQPAAPSAPLPDSDSTTVFQSGALMTVRANNFPPATPVTIAVGPLGGEYRIIGTGVTDTQGSVIATIVVPDVEGSVVLPHVVVITTTVEPISQTVSAPFFIIPASQ